ncbi:helix-turn-helix domain-containing protein [Microvirga terricola]|uniref:Helix-turn-helix domain-containing protein n=1 Tax=Microvirga terricola TaxID=2719797 RepID=A0ABX0V8H4_9HYPH|nr:helix-turn-helix domain-containing protein [Microvirga terricola]NIX76033.1 helix-turn-helix domain-containing protein [Microvirga terricola]
MPLIFDTSALKTEDQFPFWLDVICDSFLGMKAERSGRGAFEARVEMFGLGAVNLSLARLPPQRMYRDAAEIRRATEEAYCLQFINGGTAHSVARNQFSLSTGDIAIFDTTAPSDAFILDRSLNTTTIHIPKRLLDSRLGAAFDVSQQLSKDSGVVRLLADYVSSLSRTIRTLPDEVGEKAGEILCDLLAATAKPGEVEQLRGGLRAARLAAAKRFIHQNLTNPNLNPTKVSQHLGVSERYVHKLFELTGKSFSENMIAARLDACRHVLRTPSEDHRTIADIAFEYGFSDLSHFYRRYRAQWDETPGDTRNGRRSLASCA